jgi:hypothetical protein
MKIPKQCRNVFNYDVTTDKVASGSSIFYITWLLRFEHDSTSLDFACQH